MSGCPGGEDQGHPPSSGHYDQDRHTHLTTQENPTLVNISARLVHDSQKMTLRKKKKAYCYG
jgi:hypothetical protein